MISINRAWWEHLAPKSMHRRFREVETLLRQWCRTDYGTYWLEVAKQQNGVFRLKQGHPIPFVHFIALGEDRLFIIPQRKLEAGHRTLNPDQFRSGRLLQEDEFVLQPEIRFDVVEDPALLAAAASGNLSNLIGVVKKPSQLFSAPARLLISPQSFPKKVMHSISIFLVLDLRILTMVIFT